jgi:hypothetical protein
MNFCIELTALPIAPDQLLQIGSRTGACVLGSAPWRPLPFLYGLRRLPLAPDLEKYIALTVGVGGPVSGDRPADGALVGLAGGRQPSSHSSTQ